MQSCPICGSGPFKKGDFKQHELTQKHLFAAQQNEQESQRLSRQTAAIAAAVCEGREDQIPAIIAEYAALAAHQEETSSSSYVCAICAGSFFASKQNYEQHCLSQKHVKALASPSKKQRLLKAGEEVENFVPVIEVLSKKNLALTKRLTSPEMQQWMLGCKRRLRYVTIGLFFQCRKKIYGCSPQL